jgi:hypothetical protein
MTEGLAAKKKCPCCGHYLIVSVERCAEDGEPLDGMNGEITVQAFKKQDPLPK